MEKEKNTSKRMIVMGWSISAFSILFLLFDSLGKLVKPQAVIEGTVQLGYPENAITCLGILLLICTILYAIPRVSFLGAVLLTGYLGGAVATHLRVENPLFSHILFPVYLGLLIWIGLYLRNEHLRKLITTQKT